MRLNISLLVLICGLQQIFARYVPEFSWTGGNQNDMRQYWSTYDDDNDLFGLAETKDKYDDQEYKHFVATILGEDDEDDSDEATEKVSVINDDDKTTDYGFHMEDLGNGITIYSRKPEFTSNTDNLFDITKSSEEIEKVEDDESKTAATDKGVKFHWTISFGYPRSTFTSGYDAITKSSEETKDEDSLNKINADLDNDDVDSVLDLIFGGAKSSEETKDEDGLNKTDADLNTNDVDSVLDLIFGGSKSSEEANDDNMDSDHILKEIDELFKELGLDDDLNDDKKDYDDDENNKDNNADDNDHDDSYNFMLKEVDGLLKELEEMDKNSNEDDDDVVHIVVTDDDDNNTNNDDENSDDSDDNIIKTTDDILKEIDELLKELGIDDNTNEDKEDEINIVLINNEDDNNDKKDDDDDNNTDNNDNDNTNNNDNNDDNKSNNDTDDNDDNLQISFISLDDNTQNTLDNHIYDVNPTTESISNNAYYNTISNPKFDFELINAKGQDQKAQQLEAWDLKDLHDENVVDNKNDVLSEKLSENLVNYFKIRQNFDKLTETLHQKELIMDIDFLLSLDDQKESLGRFDNDIGDLSKILEDLKQHALKLQKLEQNVYVQNLLKDVVQEQFKNNGQK